MTDVRRLMGRLNPATADYGNARGGIPELTPIDIAGALGMARHVDELSAEVFCACWWREGARLSSEALMCKLRRMILEEYSARSMAASIAKLDCHIVEGEYELRRSKTEDDRQALATARGRRSRTNARKWPWNMDVYARIPQAVLDEIRNRHICEVCNGCGYVTKQNADSPRTICQRCSGRGDTSASKVSRAKALGISESAYRIVWGPTYEWALATISEYEAKGFAEIKRALGGEDEHKAA